MRPLWRIHCRRSLDTSLFECLRVIKPKYVDVLHRAGITRVPLEHIVL